MTHASPPSNKNQKYKNIAIGVGVMALLGMGLTAMENAGMEPVVPGTTIAQETTPPAPPTTQEPTIENTPEPTIVPYQGAWPNALPLALFEKDSGQLTRPVDIARQLTSDAPSQRNVIDKANWRVVAHCENVDGKWLTVGVVNLEEYQEMIDLALTGPVHDNSLSIFLDCPTP